MIGRLTRRGEEFKFHAAKCKFILVVEENSRLLFRPFVPRPRHRRRRRKNKLRGVAERKKPIQSFLIVQKLNLIPLRDHFSARLFPQRDAARMIAMPVRQNDVLHRGSAARPQQLHMQWRGQNAGGIDNHVARWRRHKKSVAEADRLINVVSDLDRLSAIEPLPHRSKRVRPELRKSRDRRNGSKHEQPEHGFYFIGFFSWLLAPGYWLLLPDR